MREDVSVAFLSESILVPRHLFFSGFLPFLIPVLQFDGGLVVLFHVGFGPDILSIGSFLFDFGGDCAVVVLSLPLELDQPGDSLLGVGEVDLLYALGGAIGLLVVDD